MRFIIRSFLLCLPLRNFFRRDKILIRHLVGVDDGIFSELCAQIGNAALEFRNTAAGLGDALAYFLVCFAAAAAAGNKIVIIQAAEFSLCLFDLVFFRIDRDICLCDRAEDCRFFLCAAGRIGRHAVKACKIVAKSHRLSLLSYANSIPYIACNIKRFAPDSVNLL